MPGASSDSVLQASRPGAGEPVALSCAPGLTLVLPQAGEGEAPGQPIGDGRLCGPCWDGTRGNRTGAAGKGGAQAGTGPWVRGAAEKAGQAVANASDATPGSRPLRERAAGRGGRGRTGCHRSEHQRNTGSPGPCPGMGTPSPASLLSATRVSSEPLARPRTHACPSASPGGALSGGAALGFPLLPFLFSQNSPLAWDSHPSTPGDNIGTVPEPGNTRSRPGPEGLHVRPWQGRKTPQQVLRAW